MEEEVGGLFVRNRRLFLLACLVPVVVLSEVRPCLLLSSPSRICVGHQM